MRIRSLRDIFRPKNPQTNQGLEDFAARYEAYAQAMGAVALNVLVWGPSLDSSSPVAQKRKDIHRALIAEGHNAMFSEDIHKASERLSLRGNELAQALAADLIFLLVEDAPGAHAELEGLCVRPDIAPKVYVFVPLRYQNSYSAHGAYKSLAQGYRAVYWYGEDELRDCNVLTEAIVRTNARREIYANAMSISTVVMPPRGVRR